MQPWLQRWEYTAILEEYDKKKGTAKIGALQENLSGDLMEVLNTLGRDGWELSAHTTMDLGGAFFHHYILKRPLRG